MTEYVDRAYAGGSSDGHAASPWTTIGDAITAAAPNAIIAIAAGAYDEDVVISDKSVRLWGRCPALVTIVGTGSALGAVVVASGAPATEVRDVAVTGPALGIALSGSEDVVIDRVWVHDAGSWGIDAEDALGTTSLAVRGSLVEDNREIGIFSLGVETSVEATVVRHTVASARGAFGGIVAEDDPLTGARSSLVVRGSVVEQNRDLGIFVSGSDAVVEATVIRATVADDAGDYGQGLHIQDTAETGARSKLTLATSFFHENVGAAVRVEGSDAEIETTMIRATLPSPGGIYGRGVDAIRGSAGAVPPSVVLRSSVIEDSRDVGLFFSGAEADIAATIVRRTSTNGEGYVGRGIEVHEQLDPPVRSDVKVRGSVVESSHEFGVYVSGSDAWLEGTLVRDTQPSGRGFGRGIEVQANKSAAERASALVRGCLVESSYEAGVAVIGSDAVAEGVLVRDTRANAQGQFGDGFVVYAPVLDGVTAPVDAAGTFTYCRADRSDRAGLSSFGGDVTLANLELACQAFDIDGEAHAGKDPRFENRGGLSCGCPDPTGECRVVSAGLAAPEPIAPVPR
jgi:hypothetical protein